MKNEEKIGYFPSDEKFPRFNEDLSRHSLFLRENIESESEVPPPIPVFEEQGFFPDTDFPAGNFERDKYFTLESPDKPNLKTWLKHGKYFFLTCLTTTLAGLLPPLGASVRIPETIAATGYEYLDYLLIFPLFYTTIFTEIIRTIAAKPDILIEGFTFSFALMTILTAHEFGHYIACRFYKVDATLPFFIPMPPLIGPAGTLGAFIKIRSPLPSKRAVFDIGVAGPIAGFVALLPFAFLALLTMQPALPNLVSEFTFSNPLLIVLLENLLGVDSDAGLINAFYGATWIGLLVTGLNLIPVGQLDGGHAVFAVFGSRFHQILGKVAFVAMCLTAIAGFYFFNSPSGFLFAVLLGFMLRVKHPQPLDNTPLDFKRKIIALITLIIFILSFTPFPIQVNF